VNGITLAHESYEKNGNSPATELLIEDDGFSATKGLSAYRKLIEVNRVVALMNGSSATIGAISPLVKRKPIPVIQFGEETEEPNDDNIFQIMPGNIEIEKALGKYISAKHPERVVLFYTLHATMVRFAQAFKEAYGHPVVEFEMDPSSNDLKPLILKALQNKPTCIVILAFPAQGAKLVKGIHELSDKKIPLAFDANFQAGILDYQELLGNLKLLEDDEVIVVKTTAALEFQEQYQKRFGENPGIGADIGYDAFTLLMKGYSDQSSDWISRLKASRFVGVSGEVVLDSVGIRRPSFTIVRIGEYLGHKNVK
jgi:ABC-type branched-subunit amino acid transport system substrate-binding protein